VSARRPGRILRAVLRAPATLYDWRLGWLLGHRFVRLSHTGRRSGRTYQTMLEVLRIDPTTGEIVVVAGLGRTTDWLRNLEAGGPCEVAIGAYRGPARHRVLGTIEAAAVLADYERRHRLITPVIRRVLTWLTGWRYDGSPEARQRVVLQLPLVGLHPPHPKSAPPDAP
jgi:deazaflavin-dependent oxidoreductase (nitroreductase family)